MRLIRAISCIIAQHWAVTVLTSQRKAFLLEKLGKDGRLIATELAASLGISEDSIRRDLRDLAADGLLIRVHGGALPASPTHRPLQDRQSLHPEAKRRLAAAAAGLIQRGMVVIVDGGSTHAALVECLALDLRCTIVTHSPAIAARLEAHCGIEIILIGGRIYRHSMVATGATTQAGYALLRADLCLLGVTGVHAETGLTTGDPEEAALKRQMMQSAAETVVLATSDKLDTTSPWIIAPLTAISTLITPDPRPDWLAAGVAHQRA